MEKDLQNTKGPEGPIARSDLSARLKVLEESYKSRAEALRAYGITKTTYDNWISEKSSPSLESIAKIAQVAGVSLDWLAFGDGDPSAEQGADKADTRHLIDTDLIALIINKHRDLYKRLANHINPDLTPGTDQVISAYNKIIHMQEEGQRMVSLDNLIEMHGETIVQMSEANQKKVAETEEGQDLASSG